MEAARSSETLVSYHSIVWHQNLEDHDRNLRRRESLKPRTFKRQFINLNLSVQYLCPFRIVSIPRVLGLSVV
jgi:hypothetical protein